METGQVDFWTDETSVVFTSFWGWSPETWATVGWTGNRGLTRRTNLLRRLTDPFITVCYVTSNKTDVDPALKGMIAGFYLVSHDVGDRNDFIHPVHHALSPEKWRHSLRATRAFTYLPEHRLRVREFNPALLGRARSVAGMGEVLSDRSQIKRLRNTPWVEVQIYTSRTDASPREDAFPTQGKVRAGPTSAGGYIVAGSNQLSRRKLYVLRLSGDIDAYLGRSAGGRHIYKIGFSASPDMRRQDFQKAMPRGTFRWHVERTSEPSNFEAGLSFAAAVAGEDAMKEYLVEHAEWLGGEFYLTTPSDLEIAWRQGTDAARSAARGEAT